jgi:methenyltetrahydromethanopterin cyclohydrolase
MAIRLIQIRDRYLGRTRGKDRWEWGVALAADDERELEFVDHVVYKLHDSYGEPIRKIVDRSDNFAAWDISTGVFEVKAKVAMAVGCPLQLSVSLSLFYPSCDMQTVYD